MTICKRTRPNERGTAMEPWPHHPQRHVFVARTSEDTSHRAGGQMRGPPQHGPQCYPCVLESLESWEVACATFNGDTITIDDRHRANVAKRPRDINDVHHTYPVHMSPVDWVYSRIVKEREERARSVVNLTDNGRSWQRQFIDAYMRKYHDGERATFARRRHIVADMIGHTRTEPLTAARRIVGPVTLHETLGLLGESWFSEDETGVYVLMPTMRRHCAVIEVTRIASREEFEKARGSTTTMEVMSELIGGVGRKMVWQQAQMSSPLIGWGHEGFGPSGMLPEEGYTPPPTRRAKPIPIVRNAIAPIVDAMREKLPTPQLRIEGVDVDGNPVSEVLSGIPASGTASFSRIDRITNLVPVGGDATINVGAEPLPAVVGPVAETFDPEHARRVFLTEMPFPDVLAAETRIEDHIANERSAFLGIPVIAKIEGDE